MRSIIRPDDSGEVDDVVIDGDLFRMERMDTNCWWVCIYRGEQRVSFFLKARGKITPFLSEDSIGCIDDSRQP